MVNMHIGFGAKGYGFIEFGKLDGAFTQLYPQEFSKESMKVWADRYDPQWALFRKANPTTAKDFPVACSYGRKELEGKTKQLPPGDITVEDIKEYLNRYGSRECHSFYSLEFMATIVYDYLKKETVTKLTEEKLRLERIEALAASATEDNRLAVIKAAQDADEARALAEGQERLREEQLIALAEKEDWFSNPDPSWSICTTNCPELIDEPKQDESKSDSLAPVTHVKSNQILYIIKKLIELFLKLFGKK
jgi:hypothetical protein